MAAPEASQPQADESGWYRQAVEASPNPIFMVDLDGVIRAWNLACAKTFGYGPEVIGHSYRPMVEPADVEHLKTLRARVLAGESVTGLELRFRTRDGSVRHMNSRLYPLYGTGGTVAGCVFANTDVTELREAQLALRNAHDELEARVQRRTRELEATTARLARANERLQHDAFHDALTGLPNRALFKDRLGMAIERTRRRPGGNFAVLFLDFDRFKVVNDSLGHAAGDALLVALGERLRGCVRPSDTVARLGGDEFVVLLEDVGPDAALETAERLREVLRRPFLLEGRSVPITGSTGVVASGAGYAHPDEVLRDADIAMYRAKALGRGRVQVFTPDLRERAVSRLAFESDLRAAARRGELEVHYQPIVATQTERPVGFEALVRWRHPVMGLIGPQEFIPVAEELGIVADIDRWVLREACAQVLRWQQAFPTRPPLTLNVNVSGQGFARPGLAEEVAGVLRETGFDPCCLKLELTESVLLEGSGAVSATLAQLGSLGVHLHLDDFGTGYSSLAYLQTFPLDVLKIDRAFVSRLGETAESAELVRSIVALARSLNLEVTAEGVETREQWERLRALGCGFGQGFLFARPLDAEAVGRFLSDADLLDSPA